MKTYLCFYLHSLISRQEWTITSHPASKLSSGSWKILLGEYFPARSENISHNGCWEIFLSLLTHWTRSVTTALLNGAWHSGKISAIHSTRTLHIFSKVVGSLTIPLSKLGLSSMCVGQVFQSFLQILCIVLAFFVALIAAVRVYSNSILLSLLTCYLN